MPYFGIIYSSGSRGGSSSSIDAYTKTELDLLNSVLVTNTSENLSISSPRHILFRELTSNATCKLPDLNSNVNYKFIIENDTSHSIIITSLKDGVLVKGNLSFTLEPHTTETFIFDTNWI